MNTSQMATLVTLHASAEKSEQIDGKTYLTYDIDKLQGVFLGLIGMILHNTSVKQDFSEWMEEVKQILSEDNKC